jgi:predicted metallopeptidase
VENRVTWNIKGVVAVKDRPDITSPTSEIQVVQPTVIQAAPTVQAAPVVKEIIREIVMIPCKYCGGLMPQTDTTCPKCGARRTA